MPFPKLARLACSFTVLMLFAVSCGGEATIQSSTAAEPTVAEDVSNSSSDGTEPTAVPPTPAAESQPEPTATADSATNEPESTETSEEGSGGALQSRDDAVAFIREGLGLVERDAECIADGAFAVFGTWDFADSDPDPEQDEQLDAILDNCITVIPGPAAGSPPPGTDAELDVLWIACDDGSATACDELFWDAPVDSDYEAFGLSCGGRAIESCSDVLGDDSGEGASGEVPGPAAGSPPPGTDAELDVLWVACDGGSAEACDDLFWQAPIDSEYEAFGRTCGGRTIAFCGDVLGDDSGEGASGEVPGPAAGSPPPGTDAELDVLWVACDGGSAEACDDLFWDSPIDSEYEAFGRSCGGRAVGLCSDVLGE